MSGMQCFVPDRLHRGIMSGCIMLGMMWYVLILQDDDNNRQMNAVLG